MAAFLVSAPCPIPHVGANFVYAPSYKVAAGHAADVPLPDRWLTRIEKIAMAVEPRDIIDLANGERPRQVGGVLALWLCQEDGLFTRVPRMH